MPKNYSSDYLLDKKVKIFQPLDGYRASSDAVMLAAKISGNLEKARILDVGSGTGAVSLCLAERLRAQNVEIHGLEIQPELAELSQMSAKANGFDFLHYHQADIREKIADENLKPCSFDVVISNPPYSESDMPSPNTSKATAHNLNDSGLSGWLLFCLKMAKPFGKIYLINRAEALSHICKVLHGKAGGMTILPIYSKKGQDAKRVIISVQKDSKAPTCILPPFVVHDKDGKYTADAQKILREGIGFSEL